MRSRVPASLYAFATAGVLAGVLVSTLRSEERPEWPGTLFEEVDRLTRLEPVRVLPHLEMSVVALEARRTLDSGRPWEAWRKLKDHLDTPEAGSAYVLLAARAAAEWGAWDEVAKTLEGRDWLERAEGGDGLYLLARAHEELGRRDRAAAAYARYASLPSTRRAASALARLGNARAATDDLTGAADAYGRAADLMPGIDDWLRTLQIEKLAEANAPLSVTLTATSAPISAPARYRRVAAEVASRTRSGDVAGALRKLEWEARILSAQGAAAEGAKLQLARGRLLLENGDEAAARTELRSIAWAADALAATRSDAADILGSIPEPEAADHLARVAAYEAAGKQGLAAQALRRALAAGTADAAGLRMTLGRLLYEARDYPAARDAFVEAASQLSEPELLAEARLYAARSLYRTGSRSRAAAISELRSVAERHAGTAAAGTALFLLGDEAASVREALSFYRRAAAVRHSPDAREALYRVGDRSLRLDDPGGALAAWEEYVARYPRGEATVRVAYEAGKIHERAGRQAKAREMYRKAIDAEPVSYYALRAGDRLGVNPIDAIAEEPRPWVGLASDPGDADAVLRRLDALEDIGLHDAWEEELASALRVLDRRPAALIALAEGLRDRNRPVEAIRLGRSLLTKRGGEWDHRLLRVVFPFPYRELIESEAERSGVDPMLLAGLIRQESTFRPAIRSWVGATGLTQIMPATGSWLASTMGIRGYEQRLLSVPEVNVKMGARYLRDQVRAYDGSWDLALAAYNAGPSRANRWRRELNYGRDTDAFREAIPFDETRNYVKVVLRNAAIYSRLYDTERPVGLVRPDDR